MRRITILFGVLLAAVLSVGQVKETTQADTPAPTRITAWTMRSGEVGYAAPYNPKLVQTMSQGWLRLKLSNSFESAGVLGPIVQLGTYTFEVRNRMDQDDPAGVRAIWTYSDATKDEVDVLEATRWRDANNPYLLYCGAFRAGNNVASFKQLARPFNKYELTMEVHAKGANIVQWGVFPDGTKKEVGRGTTDVCPVGHQLRMAYWLMKDGYLYTDSASRGARLFDVRVSFVPAPTKTTSTSGAATDRGG